MRVAVLAEGGRADDWDWAKWLPPTPSLDEASGRRLLGATQADIDAVLAELGARPLNGPNGPSPAFGVSTEEHLGPTILLVIDVDGLTEGRNAPARDLLSGAGRAVAGIVFAPSADRLPPRAPPS